jgi:hypothetical protein
MFDVMGEAMTGGLITVDVRKRLPLFRGFID